MKDWTGIKTYADFENGIPVHDTIVRVVSNIDSIAFEKMFIDWMSAGHEPTDGDVIAIDGKAIRGLAIKVNGKVQSICKCFFHGIWCCIRSGENRS